MTDFPDYEDDGMTDFPDYEDYDDDDEEQECDGCNGEGCPLCCSSIFAPGSEECDFCEHYDECAEIARSQ